MWWQSSWEEEFICWHDIDVYLVQFARQSIERGYKFLSAQIKCVYLSIYWLSLETTHENSRPYCNIGSTVL
jgi:hypothetical protein